MSYTTSKVGYLNGYYGSRGITFDPSKAKKIAITSSSKSGVNHSPAHSQQTCYLPDWQIQIQLGSPLVYLYFTILKRHTPIVPNHKERNTSRKPTPNPDALPNATCTVIHWMYPKTITISVFSQQIIVRAF